MIRRHPYLTIALVCPAAAVLTAAAAWLILDKASDLICGRYR